MPADTQEQIKQKETTSQVKSTEKPVKKDDNEYRVENKYDPYELRDVFNTFITDKLCAQTDIKESQKYNIKKIIMGIFITIIVVTSHFAPIPWPQNYLLLIFCIISYYILANKYTNYQDKVEGECFLLFQYKDQLIRFISDIKDYSEQIDFIIQYDSDRKSNLAEFSVLYREFIDKRGFLHEEKFQKVLDKNMEKVSKLISKKTQ